MTGKLRAAAMAAAACVLTSTVAFAGGLQLEPVRVTLTPAHPTAALTVRNAGDAPMVVQLRPTAWAQRNGQDAYAPTRELLATPPIFTLAPGATQVVRVGLRRAPDPRRELTYRLYLQEVPGPVSGTARGHGLRVLLRLGVPVFVAPPGAAPQLEWRAERRADGVRLTFANAGNAHVQIADLAVATAKDDKPLFARPLGAYVLAGESRYWDFAMADPPSAGTPLRLKARTDAGESDVGLVLE